MPTSAVLQVTSHTILIQTYISSCSTHDDETMLHWLPVASVLYSYYFHLREHVNSYYSHLREHGTSSPFRLFQVSAHNRTSITNVSLSVFYSEILLWDCICNSVLVVSMPIQGNHEQSSVLTK